MLEFKLFSKNVGLETDFHEITRKRVRVIGNNKINHPNLLPVLFVQVWREKKRNLVFIWPEKGDVNSRKIEFNI